MKLKSFWVLVVVLVVSVSGCMQKEEKDADPFLAGINELLDYDYTTLGYKATTLVAVINKDSQEVLIVRKRKNGEWQLPGGKKRPYVSLSAEARIEVLEETGIKVGKLYYIEMHVDSHSEKDFVLLTTDDFRGVVRIYDPSEIMEAKFIPISRVDEFLVGYYNRCVKLAPDVLKHWNARNSEPIE